MSLTKFIFYLIVLAGVAVGVINHYNSQHRGPYIAEIMDKAARYDDVGIAAEIDWVKLRAFMKADLIARAQKSNPITKGASRGAHLNPDHINKVVDYYIQPQNIVLLFRLKKGYAPYYYENDFVASVKAHKFTGIEVLFQHPENKSVSPVFGNAQVKAIFSLNKDIEWKMTELHVPLSLVPSYIPSAGEVDRTIETLNEKGLLRKPAVPQEKTE